MTNDDATAILLAMEYGDPLPLLGEVVAKGTWLGKVYSKGRPRFTTKGHAFTPKNTREFEKAIKNWMIGLVGDAVDYPCSAEIVLYDKIPKSATKFTRKMMEHEVTFSAVGDVDNRAKSILDALNEVVFLDDSQVVELNVRRVYDDISGFKISVLRAGYSAAELDLIGSA